MLFTLILTEVIFFAYLHQFNFNRSADVNAQAMKLQSRTSFKLNLPVKSLSNHVTGPPLGKQISSNKAFLQHKNDGCDWFTWGTKAI